LDGVREEVVAEVLDGLPAVPLQRAGIAVPGRRGRLSESGDGELDGLVEVVRGDRRRFGFG
jgi:hypothetical protein